MGGYLYTRRVSILLSFNKFDLIALVAILLGCVSFSSCRDNKGENAGHSERNIKFERGEFQCIACISSTDVKTRDLIRSLFDKNKIQHYSEGSVIYAVYVEKSNVIQALEILHQNDALRGKWAPPSEIKSKN